MAQIGNRADLDSVWVYEEGTATSAAVGIDSINGDIFVISVQNAPGAVVDATALGYNLYIDPNGDVQFIANVGDAYVTANAGTLFAQALTGQAQFEGQTDAYLVAHTGDVFLSSPATIATGGVLLGQAVDGQVETTTGKGTDGQLLIAATGANPEFATLTSTDGTVQFVAGANALDLSTSALKYTSVTNAMSPYTVLATDYYLGADLTGGAVTIRLPDAPAVGRVFVVKDVIGDAVATILNVTTVGGVVTIDGVTTYGLNTNYQAASFLFNGASYEVF